MMFGSVCSGIEAASVAWDPIGWSAAWFAEIEPFPAAVLAHHWPWVENLGDMTKTADMVRTKKVIAPDVLVGGTPCQAFSVAGLRGGLSDGRGQLTLEFVRLANAIDEQRKQPAIIVWENVPGVLSSADNAFGCFLAGLAGEDQPLVAPGEKWANAGCVFGPQRTVAWRILDAQYFGVAQRRRRVFVVASARAGFDPSAVLFEFDGVRRDSAPSREARQETAGVTRASTEISGFRMTAFGEYSTDGTASTMKARDYKDATDLAVSVIHGTQDPCVAVAHRDVMPTMVSGGSTEASHNQMSGQFRDEYLVPCEAITQFGTEMAGTLTARYDSSPCHDRGQNMVAVREVSPTIASNYGKQVDSSDTSLGPNIVFPGMQVRRLTPTECERLQGFPDGHTAIPVKGKPAADGPRYKALGNSMAVPVMRWIGLRISQANALNK